MIGEAKRRWVAGIAAVALGAGIAGAALASGERYDSRGAGEAAAERTRLGGAAGMDLEEAIAKLQGAGYRDIREVEREPGGWAVKARDADGRRVEVHIGARTGELERSRDRD
jgi:hypothetical protein